MKANLRSKKRAKQLLIDNLESRILLTGVPDQFLLDPEGNSNPSDFVQVGDSVFFTAQDEENGRELWITDGTEPGTSMVLDILPGFDSSNPNWLTPVGDKLFFTADDGVSGTELWMSDGTAAGTTLVADLSASDSDPYSPSDLFDFNGTLLFVVNEDITGRELWRSDGTETGTELVLDINVGDYDSSPTNLTEFDGRVFFSADDGVVGRELWSTDGTETGTQLVRDINEGEGYNYQAPYSGPLDSNPDELTVVDGTLFSVPTGRTEMSFGNRTGPKRERFKCSISLRAVMTMALVFILILRSREI